MALDAIWAEEVSSRGTISALEAPRVLRRARVIFASNDLCLRPAADTVDQSAPSPCRPGAPDFRGIRVSAKRAAR